MYRPVAVDAFGILNIAKGALGIVSTFFAIPLLSSLASAKNPVFKIMSESAGYMTWMKISIPIGLIVSGTLIGAGIGLLRLRPWARKVSIGYAIYAIIFLLISQPINFSFLFRPMMEQAHQLQGPDAAGLMAGAIAVTCGGILGFVYPILLLVFMTRPNLVAAFHTQVPPPLPSNLR